MKVSDLIAQYLRSQVNHVFAVSGGANLHLLDSCERSGLKIICMQSEAACGFAADAYARLHGLGVVITTSGPGATNLVTAIATSYYDSVPVLYVTGQQTRERMKENVHPGIRQYGFQECPILDIVDTITKDAISEVFHLPFLIKFAQSDRKGPVLLDVHDDVQRSETTADNLRRWNAALSL